MIDTGYIFAKDDKRVFLNTSLGCTGNCYYCYLSKMGYSKTDSDLNTVSAEYILEELKRLEYKINKNTLITLGCFSECWDDNNRSETKKLIKYFLQNGNQVQLSTKKRVMLEDLIEIIPLIKYYGQLVIFVSCATISKHDSIESNTTKIAERFKSFSELQKYIPTVLYIKPILKNITIKDMDLFKDYIIKLGIKNVVIGSIFTEKVSKETVHFSNKNKLFYNEVDDEKVFIDELKRITNVYKRSTQVTAKYKN